MRGKRNPRGLPSLFYLPRKELIFTAKNKLERTFQAKLIEELKERFPGCIVLKNDANYIQGFPDLTILYKDKWALLECKRQDSASRQPNQPYYIQMASEMSFASFIFPENKEEVLNDLQQAFGDRRPTRVSRRK